MANGPLGKYANVAALYGSVFVLTVNVLVHAIVAVFGIGRVDLFLDQLSILAFGILMGQTGAHTEAVQVAAAKINGLEAEVRAAHSRADKGGLPPADAPLSPDGH